MNKVKELLTKLKQKVLELLEKVRNYCNPSPVYQLPVHDCTESGCYDAVRYSSPEEPVASPQEYSYEIIAVNKDLVKKKTKKKPTKKKKPSKKKK